MKTPYIDRNTTAAIKGLALIFMFLHHFFTFPGWYVEGISYPGIFPYVRFFQTPLKMCVVLYAFLTGYFYWFSSRKTLKYSLQKITDVLISYWVAYIPLLLLAVCLGCWQFSVTGFVKELLALERPIMYFCWYVSFYYISMLLLPLLSRMSAKTPLADVCLLLVLPTAAFTILLGILEYEFGIDSGALRELLMNLRSWFPCIAVGYLCGKYSFFETYLEPVAEGFCRGRGKPLLWLGLCVVSFFCRLICPQFRLGGVSVAGYWMDLPFTMDIIYGPLFFYGAVNLLKCIPAKLVQKPLQALGKQSLLMWFLHCVFFNCCKEVTQPVLYFLKNPILVTLFGLAVCYIGAVILDFPLKKLLNLKNKLFAEKSNAGRA